MSGWGWGGWTVGGRGWSAVGGRDGVLEIGLVLEVGLLCLEVGLKYWRLDWSVGGGAGVLEVRLECWRLGWSVEDRAGVGGGAGVLSVGDRAGVGCWRWGCSVRK